jgi:hypothetical protein
VTPPERSQLVCITEAYLAQVADGLPGPRRARTALLAELRAGLLDAAEAHGRTGLKPSAAARAATVEFGDPKQIAVAFRAELRTVEARRIAIVLLTSAPLIALAWTGAALGSHLRTHHALPWQWTTVAPVWQLTLPLVAIGLVVAVGAAAAAVVASGRITRWFPDSARFAPASAIAAGIAAATVDVILLLMLTRQLASAPSKLDATPVTIAAAASIARLLFARQAVRPPRAA